MKWEELKKEGSGHYKSGDVQPIDLMKAGGILQDFAVGCIIKYAFRNRRAVCRSICISDLRKIRHYTDMLECLAEEEPC